MSDDLVLGVPDPERAELLAEITRLNAVIAATRLKGVCLTNKNIPDSFVVHLETTMGELRQAFLTTDATGTGGEG